MKDEIKYHEREIRGLLTKVDILRPGREEACLTIDELLPSRKMTKVTVPVERAYELLEAGMFGERIGVSIVTTIYAVTRRT